MSPDGSCCLIGACTRAANAIKGLDFRPIHVESSRVANVLGKCVPQEFGGLRLTTFNDRSSTTHADILAVLDCAIAKAEAEVD